MSVRIDLANTFGRHGLRRVFDKVRRQPEFNMAGRRLHYSWACLQWTKLITPKKFGGRKGIRH